MKAQKISTKGERNFERQHEKMVACMERKNGFRLAKLPCWGDAFGALGIVDGCSLWWQSWLKRYDKQMKKAPAPPVAE